jgi:general secretion pathway protein G
MKPSSRIVKQGCMIFLIAGALAFAVLLYFLLDPQNSLPPRQVRVRSDFTSIRNAVLMFKIQNDRIPFQLEGFEALVSKPYGPLESQNWTQILERSPLDPWGNPYRYVVSDNLPDGFGIYSIGPDGKTRSQGYDRDDLRSWDQP